MNFLYNLLALTITCNIVVVNSVPLGEQNEHQEIEWIENSLSNNFLINEDVLISGDVVDRDTVSRIKKDGYKVEIHTVETTDGYILTMHRIPSANSTKPPIFLQHGLLTSSSDWILTGPGKGLAYLLSDAGYDVWLGNNRGNRYSKKHSWLNPTGMPYWNFSYNEIGCYDIAAMIDYVLKNTGHKKLQYIGHSQGTTAFFVLNSVKPEYNDKILSMHALAPVAFMHNAENPFIRLLAPLLGYGFILNKLLGSTEFQPSEELIGKINNVCKNQSPIQEVCANVIFLITGADSANLNRTLIPDILSTIPAGASVNQLLHFAQTYKSKKFRMYDYGRTINKIKYGNKNPPTYNLRKITAPVSLYYGDNDYLAAVKDVKKLKRSLRNLKVYYRVPDSKWNHLNFLWGITVKELLYDKLMQDLESYQNK